jgi:hypothetical protein
MNWTITGTLEVDGHKFEVIVRPPDPHWHGLVIHAPDGDNAFSFTTSPMVLDVGRFFLEYGKEIEEDQ